MNLDENGMSRLFFERVRDDAAFRSWLLGRCVIDDPHARLLPPSKASQWRYSEFEGCWWETDIFLLFEWSAEPGRFALHIENKLASGSFTPDQVENYRLRAEEWADRYGYDYAEYRTVILAPRSFLESHRAEAREFDCELSHEEVGEWIPEFRGVAAPLRIPPPLPAEREAEPSALVPPVRGEVVLFIPGAWMSPDYVRTPPIGSPPTKREFPKAGLGTFLAAEIEGRRGVLIRVALSELVRRNVRDGEGVRFV